MMKKARDFKSFCGCNGIGIDVSKGTLEFQGLGDAAIWQREIANQKLPIEQLARALSEGGYRHKIICESTGHYHLQLGLVFARYGLDLRIINPLQSSKHQKARVRKTKTDRMDSHVLATMCLTERDLPKAANLQPTKVLIRLKQGQLHSLDKQIQRMSRSIDTYSETYAWLEMEPGKSHSDLRQIVVELKAVKRRLEKELEALLQEETAGMEEVERLRQLPGYSPLVAGLVGTVLDRQAKSHRSWAAFVGLDVSVRESGTWRGRGYLTKRGNSYIRKRLYNAAWGAKMNYPEVQVYYDRLRASGRHHTEALCIIARKLLRVAYAVLVKGKTYDAKIAFAG